MLVSIELQHPARGAQETLDGLKDCVLRDRLIEFAFRRHASRLPNAMPFSGSGALQCSHKTPERGMQIQASHVLPTRRCPTATAGSTANATCLGCLQDPSPRRRTDSIPTRADDRWRSILIGHRSKITADRELTCDLYAATEFRSPSERLAWGRAASPASVRQLSASPGVDVKQPARAGLPGPRCLQSDHPPAHSRPSTKDRVCCRTILPFSGGRERERSDRPARPTATAG